MHFRLGVFLATLFAYSPAAAETSQVKFGAVPAWATPSELAPVPASPSGAVLVRRQDVLVHLDEHGQEQYVGYRIRILQPSALGIGNVAISWNPAAGDPLVHAIKVHRRAEVIDVLKTTSFQILRREDQLEAASLDGILTATLRVADLRVGDELEVSYTARTSDPTLGNDDSGLLLLGPSPAPGRYRLKLSWDDGLKPNLKLTADIAATAQHSQNAVELRFDNPGMLSPPKDAPARFQWQRVVEYSDFSDWPAVSRRLAPLFDKARTLAEGSPVKQEARRIAASNAGALARAAAALKLVQQDVRYVFVGLDRGNMTPATAEETWQRRYGDCKGKTALLLALLGELGIKAEAVAVNNSGADDGLDSRLPSPRMFDHVLVQARIEGKVYWLDGTLPAVVEPSTTPTFSYRWVLPLTKQGSALDRVAWRTAQRPDEINLVEIDVRAGFDQPARVVSTSIVRGVKGLGQQIQFSALAADQLLGALRQELTGGTWQTIEDANWRYDTRAQASVLSITGTWKVNWEDDGDGARSLALPGGGFSQPGRRGRAPDQDQQLPYSNKPGFDCDVTTVRLPTTTRSKQWSTKPGYDVQMFGQNYYRAFAMRDGAIRMVRGFRVERDEIDAATAQRDNERIAAFDNSMAWISFEPTGQQDPIGDGTNVPATYEIDWTADNVPCVSAAAQAKLAASPAALEAIAN